MFCLARTDGRAPSGSPKESIALNLHRLAHRLGLLHETADACSHLSDFAFEDLWAHAMRLDQPDDSVSETRRAWLVSETGGTAQFVLT